MRRALLLRLAFAALAAALAGCAGEKAKLEKSPTPVRVETVDFYTPQGGRRYSAAITPYRQVTLAFRSGGFVDWIMQVRGADGRMRALGQGDEVKEGDVLARVRLKDYDLKVNQAEGQLGEALKSQSATRAQLAQAEAGASRAALDFTRATNLFATQSIVKPDYDAAKAQRESTQAQVEAARAQVEAAADRVRAAEAAVGEAGLSRSDTQMSASFGGYVAQRQVEIGALVGVGSPGFTIADLSSVKAVFGLPDLEVAGLKTGRTLALEAEALPGQVFRGVVTAISPVADSNTRLFPVEITISNPRRALLAGMIASVEPGAAKHAPVLVAPLGAVVRAKEAGFGVMVIQDAGGQAKAASRPVTLGETYGNKIQVTAGLREGERVVTAGASLLADGESVRVIP
jgi:multidrug efflux system membrane fusion protein